MSIFSKLKDMQSFHESGTAASASFPEQFGEPAYSLYTSLDFGSMSAALHNQINVTDENDEVKYTTSTKVVSIKNKTDILDAAGNKVAYMERKPVKAMMTSRTASAIIFQRDGNIGIRIKMR